MTQPPKLLVLMLDAASADLIQQWAADGSMPALGAMMRRGAVAETRSVEAFYIGATWPSYWTSTGPGTHGLYWLDRLRPGSYRIAHAAPEDFARLPTIWDAVSAAGRRLLVVDVPLMNVNPALNGVQVVEWRTHDAIFGFGTSPPTLRETILNAVGAHPSPVVCDRTHRAPTEYRQLTEQLIRGASLRSKLARKLLAEHPWDFATIVFSESHCAGHQLWHYHDPRHPEHEPAVMAEDGDAIRKVYLAIDRAIGEIVASVDADATIVVAALHNMSYTAGAANLLPEVLVRLGVMARLSFEAQGPPTSMRDRAVRLARSVYHRIPESVRLPFYQLRHRIARRVLDPSVPIAVDPGRSRCFTVPTGAIYSAIRLNLRGREPAGVLDADDADAFCRDLSAQLMELVEVESGRPVVQRVVRTADVCRGDQLGTLPDLIVEWDLARVSGATTVGQGRGAILRVRSDRIGVVEVVNDYGRTGDHRTGGILIAAGPGITPGRFPTPIATIDIAPTFARFLGCTMPAAEGRAVEGFLDPTANGGTTNETTAVAPAPAG